MGYRDFYIQRTQLRIPNDYDVHHIDGNRENNEIENLVAIPKLLHEIYHKYEHFKNVRINPDVNNNPLSYNYNIKGLNVLCLACEVIHNFIIYRNSLLGISYNYGNLDYKYQIPEQLRNVDLKY